MILLKIKNEHLPFLGHLRHWEDLKIAKEGEFHWVKGIDETQAGSVEITSIPFITRYKVIDELLFPFGSKLPIAKNPKLLWSTITQCIPIEFPQWNFNFFGTTERITVKLQPTNIHQPAKALLVKTNQLGIFLKDVSTIRLQNLEWCLFQEDLALIIGTPIPSMPGKSFWSTGKSLIPSGLNYENTFLASLVETSLNISKTQWLLWTDQSSYSILSKDDFVALSRSSFRLTLKHQF